MTWSDFNSHHAVECFTHTHPDQPVLQRAWGRASGHGPGRSVCHLRALSRRTLLHYLRALAHFQTSKCCTPPLRCSPSDLFLRRWSWCDIATGTPLLIPLESGILDHHRLNAQIYRDTDRAIRLHPRGGGTSPFTSLPKCSR